MFELKNIRLQITGLLLILGIFAAGCGDGEDPKPDDTNNNTNVPVKTGTVMFHLHTYLDEVEVDDYNIVYTTTDGRKISVSLAQLYISNIQLVRKDGSLYSIPNTLFLKVVDQHVYLGGEVPVGEYKGLRFQVGLDPATNLKTPTSEPNDVLNKPNMWFGATAQPEGYVFVNFQGRIDTTADANGTVAQMQPFNYRIGTNANYKQVMMPEKAFTIVEGQSQFQHIIIDYSKLFNGVKLNNSSNLTMATSADNASVLGAKLAGNIPSMFLFE